MQAPTSSETDPNRTTFAYTGTGRLSEFRRYSSGSVAAQGTYEYDSVGQRTRSTLTKDGVQTTTDFTYTGLTMHKLEAEEKQGETTLGKWTITYLYDEYGRPYAGIYRDTTDPQNPAAPVTFALVTTDRGDVVALLDANGSPFAAYRYDAWGNPLGQGNAGAGIWAQATTQGEAETISLDVAEKIAGRQVLRYAGYCYDSESGMYYLSARHYDPATRQFLSKDLSRNDGEQSAYGYCLGNPIANVDPSGYAFMDIFKNMKKAIAKWKATAARSTRTRKKTSSSGTTQVRTAASSSPVALAGVSASEGLYPPEPPGLSPKTWTGGADGRGPYVQDPDGIRWHPHPEDKLHYRHYDREAPDEDGNYKGKTTQWPPKCMKPGASADKARKTAEDPFGDQPEYRPEEYPGEEPVQEEGSQMHYGPSMKYIGEVLVWGGAAIAVVVAPEFAVPYIATRLATGI